MVLQVTQRAVGDNVYLVGYRGSPGAVEYRDFLERNGVPHEWIDLEQDPLARFLGARNDLRGSRLPLFLFPDGSRLEPSDDEDETLAYHRTLAELAERVGMHTRPSLDLYDVLIVGGGPAGLTAALTAASEGLKTVVVERHVPGGQAGTSARIENYPGFPNGLSGRELAEATYAQAVRFGAEFILGVDLDRFSFDGPRLSLSLVNGGVVNSRAGIGATGFAYRRLEAPGVEELLGAGVYYGVSPMDAAYHGGGDVFVVVDDRTAEESEIPADALFVLIGGAPRTPRAAGLLRRDDRGFIMTGPDVLAPGADRDGAPAWPLERAPFFLESSYPGVFAVGDVRLGSIKRVASAVGEGAMAVQFVHRYLAGADADRSTRLKAA
jgi:thioredoxin reductase (NADPH)